MSRTVSLTLLVAALAGCGLTDDSPPKGSCKGTMGLVSIDGPIDSSSTYRRVEGLFDDYDGYLDLSYAGGAFKITAEFNDPPSVFDEGTHALPSPGVEDESGLVERWSVMPQSHEGAPSRTGGNIEITGTSGRLVGTFRNDFADGSSVTCDFDIWGETDD